MKELTFSMIFLGLITSTVAQIPRCFSKKIVFRNNNETLVKNQSVEHERTLDKSFRDGKTVNLIDLLNLEPVKVEEKGDYSVKQNNSRVLRAMYNRPEGTYIQGILGLADPENFNKYYPDLQLWLASAYSIPWIFRNHSTEGATYEWIWAENSELNSTGFEPEFYNLEDESGRRCMKHGNYQLPTLKVTLDGSTSSWGFGTHGSIFASTGPTEVSNIDLYKNTATTGLMTTTRSSSSSLDGTGDGAWFGPCMQVQPATNHPEVPVGSKTSHIISFYEKPQSPMIIKMVTVLARNLNSDIQVVSNDIELTLTAYKAHKEWVVEMEPENIGEVYYEGYRWKLNIDENDNIISEKFGVSKITGNDLYRQPPNTDPAVILVGMPFKFDYEFCGWSPPDPYLLVDDAFALVIEGVDQVGQNWNIFCDENNQFDQTAWVLMRDPDGNLIRRGDYDGAGAGSVKYMSTWLSVRNIAVVLNAQFPFLYIDPGYDAFTIPEGGGKATDKDGDEKAVFLSEFNFIEEGFYEMVWIDETTVPEWITYTKESQPYFNNWDYPNWLFFEFNGEPLPTGVAGRQAKIKVRTYGTSYVEGEYVTLTINQGNVSQIGISTTKGHKPTVIANQSSFELYYSTDFNKAVVYNISGQVIETYDLPKTGMFTISSYRFNKGIYIFQFVGNDVETVKMIR